MIETNTVIEGLCLSVHNESCLQQVLSIVHEVKIVIFLLQLDLHFYF